MLAPGERSFKGTARELLAAGGAALTPVASVADRRDVPTYILSWNPERRPWETFDADVGRAARGEIVDVEWATDDTKKIVPGDRLFLLRQGSNRPGLVGAGVAVREVRPGPHFDEARRVAGDTALFTVVRFDQLLPVGDVLSTKTLRSDAVLSTFGWSPPASGLPVPLKLEARLEKRWAKHLVAHRHPVLEHHSRFRAVMERALDARPHRTPRGILLAGTRVARFGTRTGAHEPTMCWVYERRGTDLELWFGFYENFTENDLICKVVAKGSVPDGEGASIQFNGSESVEPHRVGGFAFRHNGNVTVGQRVSRADLVQLIEETAPVEAAALGGFDAKSSWPFRIGTTANLDSLLDRLFEYAFVIEQAKRARRGEPPLSALPGLADDDGGARRRTGQGYVNDVETKKAVELHAMAQARLHLEGLGFEVDDHSDRAPYDLQARNAKTVISVEVKGTQGDGSAVLLTANEVEYARSHQPHVALVVVMGIKVARSPEPVASGGKVVVFWPWDPDEHALVPTAFRCELDGSRATEPGS